MADSRLFGASLAVLHPSDQCATYLEMLYVDGRIGYEIRGSSQPCVDRKSRNLHMFDSERGVAPMSSMKLAGMIASAATVLALSSAALAADAPKNSKGKAVAADDTVHCYAINDCKGHADCGTTANSCKGHNACKAEGFKAMKASECFEAGGTIGDIG